MTKKQEPPLDLVDISELNAARKAADRINKKNDRISELANKLLDEIDNQGGAIAHLSDQLDEMYAVTRTVRFSK